MYIISFDCGIKNFAYSCIKFNDDIFVNFKSIDDIFEKNKYSIIDINNLNLYSIQCESHIIDNNKSKKNTNCINLHNHVINALLNIINKLDIDDDIKILIEYQMNINHKANIIYNIIITFFETYYNIYNKKNYNIITIQPSYKNLLAQKIDIDNKIRIKYINQYLYNKKIVTMYFLSLNSKYHFLNDKKFKKMDDISDSFIQILSYFIYYNNINI